MAIIYSYPSVTPVVADILLITQASDPSKATKSVTLSSVKALFGLNDSLNGVGTPGHIPFFETSSRLVDSFISQDANGLVFIGSQASGTRFTNTSVSSPTLTGTDLYTTNIYGNNSGLLNIQGNAIIGNEATDTLTVNSISTFNADVTVLGNTTLGDDDSTEVTMESTLSLQGPVKDSASNLGTNGQILVSNGSGSVSWGNPNEGTVKSVGITETGNALTITGSPVTSEGDINIAGAGTASQVILGDLTLTDLPVGTVKGTGTVNSVSKWSATDTLQDSIIFDDGTNVGIGLFTGQAPEDKLHVRGTIRAVATSINDYAFIGLNTSGSDALGLRYANGSGEVELKDNLGVRRVRLSCDPNDYTYFNGAKGVGVGRDVGGDAKFEVNTALSGEVGAKIISTAGVGLQVETIAANNADIQRWKIGNTIKAVVDSEGKFGIGRSDAAAELDVLGKIRGVAKDTSGFSIFSLNSNFTAASGLFYNTGSASLVLKNSANVENVKINSDGDSFLKGGRLGVGADLTTARSLTKVYVESGDIQIDQGSAVAATGIVLQTPDGSTRYKITVDNAGNIVSTQV